MAKIAYIRETKEKNILTLGITEGEDTNRYTLNRRLYLDIGSPSAEQELDEGAVEEIRAFDEAYRARKKALSLLAIADNNKNTLTLKLRRAGFSREAAESAVSEMISLGYINEISQLKRLIQAETSRYNGPKKITAKLMAKGYLPRDISRVMTELQGSGELDFEAVREELVKKYFPSGTDYEQIKKLLHKNGF